MHRLRCNNEDNRLAVTLANSDRCRLVGGEVNVLARTGTKPLGYDGREETSRCAVIENVGGLGWRNSEVDLDRMALTGPNVQAVLRHPKSLLVAGANDLKNEI